MPLTQVGIPACLQIGERVVKEDVRKLGRPMQRIQEVFILKKSLPPKVHNTVPLCLNFV